MTVTATSSKVNDPSLLHPSKFPENDSRRAQPGFKEEKQGDVDTANLGPKIPTTDHIRTNVKLNLDLEGLDSPLRDNQGVVSRGVSPFASRPSTGKEMDTFTMSFNSLKPKPPEVSVVSVSRTSKSRKQNQKCTATTNPHYPTPINTVA